MGLIFNRSGDITERTRWNLSFSGLSLSHKRGRLTLNTRGRSNFRLGRGFNIRVHTGVAYVLWVLFFVFDGIVLLLTGLAYLVVGAGEGVWYGSLFLADKLKKEDPAKGASKDSAGSTGGAVETAGAPNEEPSQSPAGELPEDFVLTMEQEPGTYDLRTVDNKIYEVILRSQGENGVLALDDIFGKKSFSPDRPYFPLVKITAKAGKAAKLQIEKGEDKTSVVYTKKIVEILKVA